MKKIGRCNRFSTEMKKYRMYAQLPTYNKIDFVDYRMDIKICGFYEHDLLLFAQNYFG